MARRPGQRPSVRVRTVVVAIVLALLPAAWLTAHRAFGPASAPTAVVSPGATGSDRPIPPASPSNPPTTPPTTAPRPTPSAASPSPTLPSVAPDAPRRLVAADLLDTGFDNAATELEAGTASEVSRWGPRGSPGSPGTDTVYVVGRVYPGGDSAFANLPRLRPGGTVEIRTDSGTLTYAVTASRLATEDTLADQPLFTTRRPGRLVLVGLRYDDAGNRLARALVVTARLSGAERR